MTSVLLILRIRLLIGDTGKHSATTSRFFTDEEIAVAARAAAADVIRQLVHARRERNILLTISPLLKQTGATGGPSIPDDLISMECGAKDGKYVPAVESDIAERYNTLPEDRVWGAGGEIRGTADFLLYYGMPDITIEKDSTDLLPLSEGFWHTVAFLAGSNLIEKEWGSSVNTFQSLMSMGQRRMASLQ